jgi:hypothetical protein
MEWSRHEGGEFSFEERRQRTRRPPCARPAFVSTASGRTSWSAGPRPRPRATTSSTWCARRNWGPRLRDRLAPADWELRARLCDAGSPAFMLDDPDYYCLYPISVLAAQR